MELRVLGCSGGIGAGLRTTSFLLDTDILIDAGSGVGDLTLEEMTRVRHIFLSHSHLDHILCIPSLLDNGFSLRQTPVTIHAQAESIEALKQHIFNGTIWPDFTRLPHPDRPVVRFAEISPGDCVTLEGRTIEIIRVNHIVPTVGFYVSSDRGAFAFSGDTTTNDSFWDALNAQERLDLLIVEAAFSNAERELCRLARHYNPELLAEELKKLRHDPQIYLTHAKPGEEEKIFEECRTLVPGRQVEHLRGGERFTV